MNISNNYKYYKGYEGEPEIIFRYLNNPNISIHIWEGYIDDIMRNQPGTDEDYRNGLSYDWNTMNGPYGDENKNIINLDNYYKDLLRFKKTKFKFEETKEVYDLIMNFLKQAVDDKQKVELIIE